MYRLPAESAALLAYGLESFVDLWASLLVRWCCCWVAKYTLGSHEACRTALMLTVPVAGAVAVLG